MNDLIIKETFWNADGTKKFKSFAIYIYKHKEIKEYLDNRYLDIPISNSQKNATFYNEVLYRIKNNIEIRPKCKTCGNPNIKFGFQKFSEFCSISCSRRHPDTKEKLKNTCLERYGVINGGGSKQALEKIKNTCMERYGVINGYSIPRVREKSLKTIKEHKEEIVQKRNNTLISKYGSLEKSYKDRGEKRKENCQKKYGVDNVSQLEEVKLKKIKTQKQNKTFKVSFEEDLLFCILKSIYPSVSRYHIDDIYNFNCDFYIKHINLYIEYQGCMMHNTHLYKDDFEDRQKAKEILKKIQETNSIKYKKQYETWVSIDPNKYKIAIEKNLNFISIYPNFYNVKIWKKITRFFQESNENFELTQKEFKEDIKNIKTLLKNNIKDNKKPRIIGEC